SSSSIFGRAFGGRAPTVIYVKNRDFLEFRTREIDRIRLDGPVVGVAIGTLEKTKRGNIYYLEGAFSAQFIEIKEGVQSNGEVPSVVSRETLNDKSTIYTFYFTAGILLF